VEYMECKNQEYLKAFENAGYSIYAAVGGPHHRGNMCAVKDKYRVEEIFSLQNPHMYHIRIHDGDDYVDLITLRLLVAGGSDSDYLDRKVQWERVMSYIDGLKDTEHLVVTGDWNHGVIADHYTATQSRRYFNYQMIAESLQKRQLELVDMEGMSFGGYMKIDHIACGGHIQVLKSMYMELFAGKKVIGIPDHKSIVADLVSEN